MSGLRAAGETSVALWMDTLCIPVQENFKSYRKQAIKLMSQTYRAASAVLVLDNELQRLETCAVSLLEQDILTSFVGWSRRLWTLQEAALAHRLYIQTLRAPYKLETSPPAQTPCDSLLAQIYFREDITAFTRSRIPPMATLKLTVFETSPPSSSAALPINTSTTTYQRLAHALQHRSTSKPADEPVILAITLGLPLSSVLDAPEEDRDARMGALLVLLRDVPADIVFWGAWPGERCTKVPFRWAPRSLLGFPRRVPRATTFGPGAVCDERGLHASYQRLFIDAGAGGNRELTGERWYAVDRASGMKYEFGPRADLEGGVQKVPERCALLLRAFGIEGDTAVATVLREGQGDDGRGGIEVTVVGHWVMYASGAGLECAEGAPVLEGRFTASDQRWCVT
ncbi:hypothetical protein K438DRAFT_128248 [Mycena galopus ATCC 62051]|nr:hypothetical protein K438DRAFT_128248 [Mycena galopus ATCC 62051]